MNSASVLLVQLQRIHLLNRQCNVLLMHSTLAIAEPHLDL